MICSRIQLVRGKLRFIPRQPGSSMQALISSLFPPIFIWLNSLQVLSQMLSYLIPTTDFYRAGCIFILIVQVRKLTQRREEKRIAKGYLTSKWKNQTQRFWHQIMGSFDSTTGTLVDLVITPYLKQSVFLGSWFTFKMHQPVKLQLDISPSLNSHHNNIDIWRRMWDGQKLMPV